ncbi:MULTISPECIES: acyltransferase [unclassified Hyphomonas]|uniref:acyltransferase family protein n=1 Tax=unclassified Hyphomonas TaxID=2630699 RepID=UPI000A53E147|nr:MULTISPECIES: acyltransferase [unclassified Hyphomonas]
MTSITASRRVDLVPTRAFETIDLIRFLAAAQVTWSHVWLVITPNLTPEMGPLWRAVFLTASFGQDAVRIFFVISGYWITRSVLRRIAADRWSWSSYLTDRLTRLWIVAVPALLLGGLLDILGRYVFDFSIYSNYAILDEAPIDLGERLTVPAFLGNIAFLQNIFYDTFGSNFPLWSLANEFWYYLWFPALILLLRQRAVIPGLMAFITFILFFDSNVSGAFGIWLIGSAVYVFTEFVGGQLRQLPMVTRYGLGGLAGLVFLSALGFTRVVESSWLMDGLVVGAGFGVFLCAVILFDLGIPALARPGAVYGAGASYSLYVCHFPAMLMAIAILQQFSTFGVNLTTLFVALSLTLVLFGVGWGFSRMTENHTAFLRSKIAGRLRPTSLST